MKAAARAACNARDDDAGHGVVISSRIRLARNLHGVAFPDWAGGRERQTLFTRLCHLLTEEPLLEQPTAILVDDLDGVERSLLQERHLISAELAAGGIGAGVVHDRQAGLSVMINEEDHLRLQVLYPGLDLQRAWAALDRLDSGLERHLVYAFSPALGYLTACPSNVGTGMRASVMLHLAGLRLWDEAEPVVRGLNRTGFAVRGAFGEGSEAFGGLYQISNQVTLGLSEADTLGRLEDMVRTLVRLEHHARQRLWEQAGLRLKDHVGRVFGVLQHAQLMSAGEGMDIISGLILGLEYDRVKGIGEDRLAAALRRIQPGHLQQEAGRVLSSAPERDAFRADFIRRFLTGVELAGNL